MLVSPLLFRLGRNGTCRQKVIGGLDMGRLVTIVALLIASTTAAFAEDAIDPTVWSKDQWRSDLFHTYATHSIVPSRTVVRRVVIEKILVTPQDAAQREAAPVRPKLIIIGDDTGDRSVLVQHPGHACDGVLTLTWMGDHAQPHCNRSTLRHIKAGG